MLLFQPAISLVVLAFGAVTVTARVKGGDYVGREIADPRVKDALLDYLRASGRLGTMDAGTPLWTSARPDQAA